MLQAGSHAAEKARQKGLQTEEQRRAAVAAKRAEQLVRLPACPGGLVPWGVSL